MSSGVAPAAPVGAEASVEIAVEIDVDGRWDALALSELLIPFHPFLAQHTAEGWVVHAPAPDSHGRPLADALRAIEEWQAERRLDARRTGARCRPPDWVAAMKRVAINGFGVGRARREAQGVVYAALEFALAGTEPEPSDALKYVYAEAR